MKHGQLAHIWAHQSKPHLSLGNMSFSGRVIFSYNTAIGEIVEINGEDYYLINGASYSSSTSTHQSYVRRSVPAGNAHTINMTWLDPMYNLGNLKSLSEKFNAGGVLNKLQTMIVGCLQHREGTAVRLWKMEKIDNMLADLDKYTRLFNLSIDLNSIRTAWANEDRGSFDEAFKLAKQKTEDALLAKEAEALAKWRKGESVRNHFKTLALRIKDDRIETTQSAFIPVEDAISFWERLKTWIANKNVFKDDSGHFKLGGYPVKAFDGKTLTVGCHTIPVKELKLMAKQLKLS